MTMHNAKGLEFRVVFITGLEDGLFPLARAYDEPSLLEEERRLFYVGITRAEEKLFLSHAEQRRRNGELLPSRPSGFLEGVPPQLLEKRKTIKARSSGRGFLSEIGSRGGRGRDEERGGGWAWGQSNGRLSTGAKRTVDGGGARQLGDDELAGWSDSAARRRPGQPAEVPVTGRRSALPRSAAEEGEEPPFATGARVRHRKFGSGTVAELAGSGRDLKVKIDFDDESVGRKTLVVAQANLEPEGE
jgi:DNA helicase-2/ATP-dependent DNA helicase PcrA